MASFWAGSIARGSKHAFGGIALTAAASTLVVSSPISRSSTTSYTCCEHEAEFKRRHEQLKEAKKKKVNLQTRVRQFNCYSSSYLLPYFVKHLLTCCIHDPTRMNLPIHYER